MILQQYISGGRIDRWGCSLNVSTCNFLHRIQNSWLVVNLSMILYFWLHKKFNNCISSKFKVQNEQQMHIIIYLNQELQYLLTNAIRIHANTQHLLLFIFKDFSVGLQKKSTEKWITSLQGMNGSSPLFRGFTIFENSEMLCLFFLLHQLHIAAEQGLLEEVKCLVKAGTDVNIQDDKGVCVQNQ